MVESFEITEMGSELSLFQESNNVQEYQAKFTFTIEQICKDLEDLGYSVQPMLIPAAAVGAPHRRDRVFIIAYSAGCRSESYSQNGGAEGNGGRKYAQQGKWSEQTEFNNGFLELSRNATDADCWGRSEVDQHIQSELTDGAESIGNGGKWDAADSKDLLINGGLSRYGGDGVRQEVSQLGGRDSEAAAHTESQRGKRCGADYGIGGEEQEQSGRVGGESIARMLPGERWKGFPTVSAVHRGNDGLPFDVDDLAIPFVKWKNESLKAYGNAIVPQVMYGIFQAIEDSYKHQCND